MGMTNTSTPTIAVSSSGKVYVTTESGDRSALASSADGGTSFGTPAELVSPSGELGYPQLEAGGEGAYAVGTAPDGSVWVHVVE
jgi:hypothetical protein